MIVANLIHICLILKRLVLGSSYNAVVQRDEHATAVGNLYCIAVH